MKQLHPMLSWLSLSALLLSASTAGAGSTPAGTIVPNTATATYDLSTGISATTTGNTVNTTVLGVCSTTIKPNTPTASVIAGATGVFSFTVTNEGNGSVALTPSTTVGSYTLYLDVNGDGLLDSGDTEITEPATLAAGLSENVLVKVTTATTDAAGNYTVSLAGACDNGNTTVANSELILTVPDTGKPELVKTSDAPATTVLAQGDTVNYTLTITNPYNRPLTNVVITDKLPDHMSYISSDQGGVSTGGVPSGLADTSIGNAGATVTWNLGTIPANGEVKLHITGRVITTPNTKVQDGDHIDNTFTLTSTEFPTALPSNQVSTVVLDPAKLDIEKSVNNSVASMGDTLTYTVTVTNNAITALNNTSITDLPAPGLVYVSGTSTLDGNAFADPVADTTQATLTWNNVGAMAPGQKHTITYKMRVTPAVSGDLVNTANSTAYTADSNKAVRSVKSKYKSAVVRPLTPNMAAISDIVGLVYVDRNRNGMFDKYIDTPVERARVILAGGRLALTDKDGRYHFANVKSGTQALRLDPNTTPYNPLNIPQSQGLSGTQTVYARGLTSVDFPLAPVGGDITAIRRTRLDVGDVHVQKVVYHTDQGYVVAMTIDTPKALENFVLQDPLPAGATLQEGRNTLEGTLPAGKSVVNYRFSFAGGDEAAVTDPNVVWRY